MKGYKFAVAWIALNDSPASKDDVATMEGYVSVALVADLFGKPQNQVARAVYRFRLSQISPTK